jgi:small subunit ribosomal protein S6
MAENRYESTFIIQGSLEDDAADTIVQKAEDTITKNGGTLIETERWGRRKLAYDIEKETSGHYVSLHFTAPGTVIAKLERVYQLDEQVMRWLTLLMPETSIKGRLQMKKRVEDVAIRREAQSALAAEEEANAAANARKPKAVAEETE